MSGLAGILRLDGAPVDPGALDAMVATMPHRAVDGRASWIDGPVGLAHLQLRTTAEAAHEHQPVQDDDAQVCLTLDGRIDNRAELRAGLGAATAGLRDGSDAELLLRSYLRWGPACLSRVVGEFAVALWDGRQRELILARDLLGKRPLLYQRDRTAVRWASELQAVLVDPAVPRRPNLAMVGERLSLAPRSTTDTLFEAVQRVPPAHLVVIDDAGMRVERHWLAPAGPGPSRDLRGHVEELVRTLDDATTAALDAPSVVAAELSGGVDSSTVVATADHLVRTGRSAAELELLALVFPGEPCDESSHIRRVAAHVGRPVVELHPAPAGAAHYLAQIDTHLDLPEPPNLGMHRDLHVAARERGARVLLTGSGGDEWFSGSPLVYADALRRLRLLTAARVARADRQVWASRGWGHQLWRDGLAPLVPEPVGAWIDRRRGVDLPAWMPRTFWEGVGLVERLRRPRFKGADLARAHVAGWLEDGVRLQVAEAGERTLARAGLEARSPLDDRRVVELALALPEGVRRHGSIPKWMLRTAMADRLPPETVGRVDKAVFSSVLFGEMAAQGGPRLFDDLAIAELGWVEREVVRDLWKMLEDGHRAGLGRYPWASALWTILSTERWARATL